MGPLEDGPRRKPTDPIEPNGSLFDIIITLVAMLVLLIGL